MNPEISTIARLMQMLTRQGYLIEEQGMTYQADIDADNSVRAAAAPSIVAVSFANGNPSHRLIPPLLFGKL